MSSIINSLSITLPSSMLVTSPLITSFFNVCRSLASLAGKMLILATGGCISILAIYCCYISYSWVHEQYINFRTSQRCPIQHLQQTLPMLKRSLSEPLDLNSYSNSNSNLNSTRPRVKKVSIDQIIAMGVDKLSFLITFESDSVLLEGTDFESSVLLGFLGAVTGLMSRFDPYLKEERRKERVREGGVGM